MYILFLAILGVPAFRAEGYRFKARPVCRFCSEVPLLSEEYWQWMFVYYFCIIEVSVCHNEIPLLGEEILLRYIVYISSFTHSSCDCLELFARTCSFML